MELQQAIADHMTSTGDTYRAIADKVGVSHMTIQNWRSGRSRPPMRHLTTLLDVMGSSASHRRAIMSEAMDVKASDLPGTVGL